MWGLTWIRCSNRGSASKITGSLSLTFLLEIAVDSIWTMSSYSVGVVTTTILMDRATVCPSSTCIVQCFLQDSIAKPIFANTPISTYKNSGKKKIPSEEKQKKKKIKINAEGKSWALHVTFQPMWKGYKRKKERKKPRTKQIWKRRLKRRRRTHEFATKKRTQKKNQKLLRRIHCRKSMPTK